MALLSLHFQTLKKMRKKKLWQLASILMARVGSSCWRSRARAIHMRRSYDIFKSLHVLPFSNTCFSPLILSFSMQIKKLRFCPYFHTFRLKRPVSYVYIVGS